MHIKNSVYYLYILRCADHSLYCGVTNDIERRVREHNGGGGRGAKYVRGRLPVLLVYTETYPSKNDALKREHQIKQMTKIQKESLVVLQ